VSTVELVDRARRRQEALLLTICCSALFMTTLDGTILNVALPSIQRHLGASTSGLQWTVVGYTLTRASSLFVCGSLADRFGRRRAFTAGLVIFTLGSLACGLAPDLGALIVFRCLQGIGSAVLTPSSLAIITNTFTDAKRRSWAVGMWNTATGVSTTAGPVIGGLLVQAFGWRSVFLVNLPIGAAAVAWRKILPESRAEEPRPFDIPGQSALAVALSTLTYALISGPDDGWSSPLVVILLVVSLASCLAFVRAESRSPHPLIDLHYLARPALSGAALLAICAFVVIAGFQFLNTLYLQEVRGYSPLQAGLLFVPISAAVLVFSPIAGRMNGRRGPRLPATLAMAAMLAAMVLLTVGISLTTSLVLLVGVFLLVGTGSGLVNTSITAAAISSMPKDRAAVAGAVGTMGRQVGSNLGVALIGSIAFSIAGTGHSAHALASVAADLSFVHGLRVGNLITAVIAALGIAVALWAFRSNPLPPEGEEAH